MIEGLVKGDSIQFDCTVKVAKLPLDLSNYKIRAELYDSNSNSIKLANIASGGSDNQILITDATNGLFSIFVDKLATKDFDNTSNIEIELESQGGKLHTPYQDTIDFNKEQITWQTPT